MNWVDAENVAYYCQTKNEYEENDKKSFLYDILNSKLPSFTEKYS